MSKESKKFRTAMHVLQKILEQTMNSNCSSLVRNTVDPNISRNNAITRAFFPEPEGP